MSPVRDQRVTMDSKGRVVLPRSVREAAGLLAGNSLVASVEADGTVRIEKISARIAKMQDRFAKYAIPRANASDELIADRRLEAERE
jgi:AbrB family looped-hinge helix DNA binding protein